MTDTIPIRAGERGIVRVFALDLPAEDVARFAEPRPDWPLKAALGADSLDPERTEVFAVEDLADLGLSGYLAEGLGVSDAQLGADAAMLDALQGHVVVVPSSALGGVAQSLRPRAPLRHLATYQEADTPPVAFEPLPFVSARGTITAPTPPVRARRQDWRLVLLGCVLIAVAIAALALAFARGANV